MAVFWACACKLSWTLLDSSFARPGSAPLCGGKKGEFGDCTTCSLAAIQRPGHWTDNYKLACSPKINWSKEFFSELNLFKYVQIFCKYLWLFRLRCSSKSILLNVDFEKGKSNKNSVNTTFLAVFVHEWRFCHWPVTPVRLGSFSVVHFTVPYPDSERYTKQVYDHIISLINKTVLRSQATKECISNKISNRALFPCLHSLIQTRGRLGEF